MERIRKVIISQGEKCDETATLMVSRWNEYSELPPADANAFKYGSPIAFFEKGVWLNPKAWPKAARTVHEGLSPSARMAALRAKETPEQEQARIHAIEDAARTQRNAYRAESDAERVRQRAMAAEYEAKKQARMEADRAKLTNERTVPF